MRRTPVASRTTAVAAAMLLALGAAAVPASAGEHSAYAGADTCRKCHGKIWDAWQETKHAHAINRLQHADRQKECIACHVTGSPEMIAAEEGSPSHPNVQCEACHGPGGAHAARPQVTEGLVRSPQSESCQRCHNARSPHYKGFVFAAMKLFVH